MERRRGDAGALHDVTDLDGGRRVLTCEVTHPAWVLGSAQPDATVERVAAEGAGIAVVRRRSGGGAVLLVPHQHVWVDVVLPADDPLAEDDVERATWWLGDAWARALATLGVPSPQVHRRGVTDRALGRVVCFAALGPGEVAAGGRKVVGVSQRRTRSWTRLQCVVHLHFDAATTASLVATDERDRLEQLLDDGVGGLERWSDATGPDVVDGFLAELERLPAD